MKIPFKKQRNNDEHAFSLNDILNNVKSFFDPQPQKEKVLRHEDFNGAGDVYYANVSIAYKITQRFLVVLLVVFLILSLVTNFKSITYNNFFYLVKDFSNAMDIESSNYDTLSYPSNSRHFFALYRGGLAVVNPSTISVFTATGRNTLKTQSVFSAPCIEATDKYFLIYDTAATTFSVYNSFVRVYSESLDYPITDACFANNGYFAVVTRDIGHKSLVHIYDDDFDRLFTVQSDTVNKFAFDVDIDDSSDSIAICYYDIGNGTGKTEIVIRKLSDMSVTSRLTLDSEFPVSVKFIGDSKLAAISDSAISIYNKKFEQIEKYKYDSSNLTGYNINEYGVAVAYTKNSQSFVAIYDNDGNLIFDHNVNENINDIIVFENFSFLRTDSGVVRIDLKNNKQQFLPSSQGKMLIYSADTALICGESRAEYLVFK